MKRFFLILAMPFLASFVFGWGAFPIVCALYFVSVLCAAILRAFGIKLLADDSWGYVPSGFNSSINPTTGLQMVGAVDVGGNALGAGHRIN